MTAPVTIVTPVSEKFWGKFADDHIKTVLALSPQPAEVIVVSEVEVDLPDGWVSIPLPMPVGSFGWVGAACNAGFRAASSEWVIYKPVDDLMDPNFFDGMPYAGDAVNVAGRFDGGFCHGEPEQFHTLLNINYNGMPGWILLRRSTALRVPFRPVYFDDWAFWVDLRGSGGDARFDRRTVWTWRKHEDSFSHGSAGIPDEAVHQINLLKRMHREGRVRLAAEWPPVFE